MSALLKSVLGLAAASAANVHGPGASCSRGSIFLCKRLAHAGDFAAGVKRRALPTTTSIKYTIPTDAYLLAKKFQEVARQGKLDDAVAIVMQTKTRSQSVVVWNQVIEAYAQEGRLSRALRGYSEMRRRGFMPTPTTFTALLKACALSESDKSQAVADELFDLMAAHGVEASIINVNALLNVYQRKHDIDKMLARFNELPEDGPMAPALATYTILLSSLRRELLARLHELSGKPDADGEPREKRPALRDDRRTALLKENVHRTFGALLQVWTSFAEDVDRRLKVPDEETPVLAIDAHIVNVVLKACHSVYKENRSLGRKGLKVIEQVYGLDMTLRSQSCRAPDKTPTEAAAPLAVRLRQRKGRRDQVAKHPVLDNDTISLALELCTRDGEYTKAVRFWRSLEANFGNELHPLKQAHIDKIEALYARLSQPRPR
ncbi:hypothetical protein GGI04_004011 [Coemansia thaxteri]|nr:hypothetical protein GGI04_004011 [Coemansia thaxteri]KAJ2468517.1 hypothetical protein GGI02_003677 [Coemansia sp. RSA 2322]